MFKGSANYPKLKTNLRLAINRFKLCEKKKTELALKARQEIADYISGGKEDRARIRVEHIIREDYLVEAMEMLEMYCDLLLARFGLISSQKELDPGLEESIASIMWATPRLQTDINELKTIFDQFSLKYGKEFALACRNNTLSNVNEKVMHRLGVQPPSKVLVERYMIEIARNFNVSFEPDPTVMQSDEIYAAENLLSDYEEPMKNPNDSGQPPSGGGSHSSGGGFRGSGGGGGGQVMPPSLYVAPPTMPYPSEQPAKQPPPLPSVPPAASVPGPGWMYPTGPGVHPSAGPSHSSLPGPSDMPIPTYNEAMNIPPDNFPDLPNVPSHTVSTMDAGTSSVGGEDVDFDDLTRRFQELKRKK